MALVCHESKEEIPPLVIKMEWAIICLSPKSLSGGGRRKLSFPMPLLSPPQEESWVVPTNACTYLWVSPLAGAESLGKLSPPKERRERGAGVSREPSAALPGSHTFLQVLDKFKINSEEHPGQGGLEPFGNVALKSALAGKNLVGIPSHLAGDQRVQMGPEIPRNFPSWLFPTCQGHVWSGWGLPYLALCVTPSCQPCPCRGCCQSHVSHMSITPQCRAGWAHIRALFDRRWGGSGCQSPEGEGKGKEMSWGENWGIYYPGK